MIDVRRSGISHDSLKEIRVSTSSITDWFDHKKEKMYRNVRSRIKVGRKHRKYRIANENESIKGAAIKSSDVMYKNETTFD